MRGFRVWSKLMSHIYMKLTLPGLTCLDGAVLSSRFKAQGYM